MLYEILEYFSIIKALGLQHRIKYNLKNSKVFEQKGNLLSFKVNIDPK